MAEKKATTTGAAPKSPTLPSPRSRREAFLESLLENTTNPTHQRILKAYMASGTVQGAEQEFEKIINEIVDEA